ncbi:MAG: hypothetical protein AAB481_05030 [Patescibacteria group bacterium]
MKIAIIYSLPTRRALVTPFKGADEDTRDSALEIAEAIKSKGVDVLLVPVSEDTINEISQVKADCIFTLIEWDGMDMSLFLKAMNLIDQTGIPYTGSSLSVMTALADKVKMKEALDLAGIPTPRWQLFRDGTELVRDDFYYPVIMKLALTHCSIGLTRSAVIDEREDLASQVKKHILMHHQPIYAEEFIEGREFQVTVIEEKGVPIVLPPAEIVFKKGGKDSFLTYESRWDEKHPDYNLSSVKLASVPAHLAKRLRDVSLDAFRSLGMKDYSRMDIRSRGEEPFILEANTNPGLGDSDDYGMTVSYKAVGWTFADFCWKIVESCLMRAA